jgi:hypothetical protein
MEAAAEAQIPRPFLKSHCCCGGGGGDVDDLKISGHASFASRRPLFRTRHWKATAAAMMLPQSSRRSEPKAVFEIHCKISLLTMAVSNFAQALAQAKRQSYLCNISQVLAGNSSLK